MNFDGFELVFLHQIWYDVLEMFVVSWSLTQHVKFETYYISPPYWEGTRIPTHFYGNICSVSQ